jgi:glycosyltransferase involved in cell wall biosynthesis
MKTLLITCLDPASLTLEEQRHLEEADASPNITYFDDLVATDIMDQAYLSAITGLRGKLYQRLPGFVAQALEAYRLRNQYDAIVTWDDHLAMFYSLLLTGTHARSRHIAILIWTLQAKKRLVMRFAQHHMDHLVVSSDIHRELLHELVGIPRAKITYLPTPVDVQFWSPEKAAAASTPSDALDVRDSDMICAVSCSKHDHNTLMQAMRDLPMTCRMVAVDANSTDTRRLYHTKPIPADVEIPANVICGPCTAAEVRSIYANARFVVAPVEPSFIDYGATTVTEAMAMGKAVICTRTYSLMQIVEPGVTGLLVPPADPQALRDAIQYLWDNPEVAERMGAEARRRIEAYDIRRFSAGVNQAIEQTVAASLASRQSQAASRLSSASLARARSYATTARRQVTALAESLRPSVAGLRRRLLPRNEPVRSDGHYQMGQFGASALPSHSRVAPEAVSGGFPASAQSAAGVSAEGLESPPTQPNYTTRQG